MQPFPACAQRTEPGSKAGVKKGEKKRRNEKLGTLIRSYLSKELLRRKSCSAPSASITVGSDVRLCLVQRAPRKPELMSLELLLPRGFCSEGVTSGFHPEFCPITTGEADSDSITASTCRVCESGGG